MDLNSSLTRSETYVLYTARDKTYTIEKSTIHTLSLYTICAATEVQQHAESQ